MKRGGYIQRKTRIKQVNRKRKAALFRKQFLSVERVLWVKGEPCSVETYGFWALPTARWPVCEGPGTNAHRKSRGAGGTWREIAPLCRKHHGEQHAIGIQTFQRLYGLDLAAIAAELATRGPQE